MPGAVFSRRPVRLITVAALSLALAAPFGWTAWLSWAANSADARFVDRERTGTSYLRPLGQLVSGLTVAQSAAVRGEAVDAAAVRASVDAVDTVDRAAGSALGTTKRWVDLRGQIDRLLANPTSGRRAYDSFAPLVALCLDLARQVGDASNLIHDPDLDSYYLMDAALLRLPEVMVYAGRAADLAALAGPRTLARGDATEVAVARYRVAAATGDAATGLRKSVASTSRAELGPAVTVQLDALLAAVDDFAPPIVLAELAAPVNRDQLATSAQEVGAAARALSTVVLSELDTLLADRQGRLSSQRRGMAAAAGVSALAGLLLAWVLGLAAGLLRQGASQDGQASDAGDAIEVSPREYADDLVPGDLIDARELDFEELVHVGRAVRSRQRERADDDSA